jgi:hypothetical protein
MARADPNEARGPCACQQCLFRRLVNDSPFKLSKETTDMPQFCDAMAAIRHQAQKLMRFFSTAALTRSAPELVVNRSRYDSDSSRVTTPSPEETIH